MIESYHHSFLGLFKPLNAALYASFTHELYDKIKQGVTFISPDNSVLQQFVDVAERRYDYINQAAANVGCKFFLIWQPYWWVETASVAPEVKKLEDAEIILPQHLALRHNFEVINRALVDRLKDKPYFIDFQNILASRTEPVYESDGIHLRDKGNEIVAARIGHFIKERFLSAGALGGNSR